MLGRGFNRLKRMIAMVCVAMSCVLVVQTTVIVLDRLDHALEIEHNLNPLAGAVQSCGLAAEACEDAVASLDPMSHAHLGDAVTSIVLGSTPFLTPIDFERATIRLASARAVPGLGRIAPDRPPKA